MQFSIQDIAEITQGSIERADNLSQRVTTFCTDSRRVRNANQSIFVAIQSQVRDGHLFIGPAYDKGIRCFLISDTKVLLNSYPEANFIVVSDTLRAMQALTAAHRSNFKVPVFGITGSNGKTIVKEWLALLFSKREHVLKSPKSYNSQLGVALSVSGFERSHSLALFEAGISEPNEMQYLQEMIQPTLGVFTTIGAAHDVNFSSTREKIQEKLKLFTKCKKLYYCIDHELIHAEISDTLRRENTSLELKTWGQNEDADLKVVEVSRTAKNSRIRAVFSNKELELLLPYTDSAYIENAMHCWLVLLDAGYEHDEISPWFMELPPVQMRLELLKGINDCTLINDTYSSDLASLRIALDFLYEQKQHSRYSLILSDILQHNKQEVVYKAVVELLQQRSLSKLILIGNELGTYRSSFNGVAEEVIHFERVTDFLRQYDIQQFDNEAVLIKGARRFMLERIVNRLEENIHRTVLSINLSAFVHNINAFKKRLHPTTKVMAMVKAFSYGSGSYEVAHTLEHHGVDYLAVAYIDEGIHLRKKGIQLPILILNPELSSLDALLHYRLEPEIYSLELLEQFGNRLIESGLSLPIHIKLDTGMHRLGVEEKDLDAFLDHLKTANCFDVKSVFSHLVGSDDDTLLEFTKTQKECFEKMTAKIEKSLEKQVIKHLANSAGALHTEGIQYDMVRLGLGLYGISHDADLIKELEVVSTLKTQISQIKVLSKNETVGYGRAGVLDRDSKIATLNIGYADGYSRSFSLGKGKVLIHGQLAPVLGNVCMDMIMVDITHIDRAQEGDEVIIFGKQLPVTQLAQWINTIPYEIIAGISRRVKRVFYRE